MRLHVVLPGDIDDPAAPSGGNRYDRRVCDGLVAAGWSVREHAVPGDWHTGPGPDGAATARALACVDDGEIVLLDGLVAASVPQLLGPAADRLTLVVLVHQPPGDPRTRAALAAAHALVSTSRWSSRVLLADGAVSPARVHLAPPGVDPAPVGARSPAGGRLLCVGAVLPHKGHDVLVEALAGVRDLAWSCRCVGSLERDPRFVAGLDDLGGRIRFVGVRTGATLAAEYAAADLLVLPSRTEAYGMVVTEALARGVPVLGADVGGVAEALGSVPDRGRPGELVPPADPPELSRALRRWLTDHHRRSELRSLALVRREGLRPWTDPVDRIARVLSDLAADRAGVR